MAREYLIRLPWPARDLSPNARVHWTKRAKAAKKARADAMLLCQAQGCRMLQCDRLTVEITFYPPDNRPRDTDNMLASLKPALDGLADASGVDDSLWHYGIARGEPIKGGSVVVHVTPSE